MKATIPINSTHSQLEGVSVTSQRDDEIIAYDLQFGTHHQVEDDKIVCVDVIINNDSQAQVIIELAGGMTKHAHLFCDEAEENTLDAWFRAAVMSDVKKIYGAQRLAEAQKLLIEIKRDIDVLFKKMVGVIALIESKEAIAA